MPRIIVSSRFLKNGTSGKRYGLVKYIATRESVEMYSPQSRGIPVTKNQTELIQKLLEMFPEEKRLSFRSHKGKCIGAYFRIA